MKGLLIDYGGVLTTSVLDAFREFCDVEGLDPDAILSLYLEDAIAIAELHGLETGILPEREFELALARRLGLASSENLLGRVFAGLSPEPLLIEAVRRLRGAGFRTCLLSNSWGFDFYDRELFPELFDAVVLSGEVGIRKPDREIFDLARDRIGLDSADCVFVDDLPWNCSAAEELGFRAIRHREAAETVAALEREFACRLTD